MKSSLWSSSFFKLPTNQVGGGFHWQPATFDNAADVKCCFSIFCTITVNKRGDAKLIWCYFSNKIYSAVVSCELLHALYIMLYILYIRCSPSFELLCEWNPMVRLFKWAIKGAIRTYMPTLPCHTGVSRIRHQSPGLPYGSPYLPDKIIFWVFLCLSLRFSPFLAQNLNFCYS